MKLESQNRRARKEKMSIYRKHIYIYNIDNSKSVCQLLSILPRDRECESLAISKINELWLWIKAIPQRLHTGWWSILLGIDWNRLDFHIAFRTEYFCMYVCLRVSFRFILYFFLIRKKSEHYIYINWFNSRFFFVCFVIMPTHKIKSFFWVICKMVIKRTWNKSRRQSMTKLFGENVRVWMCERSRDRKQQRIK